MINTTKLIPDWDATLEEVLQCFGKPQGTRIRGAINIGKGQTGEVWSIAEKFVIKVYRPREGVNIPRIMQNEIETYETLSSESTCGLPVLHDHNVLPHDEQHGSSCGWALFSRVPGKSLTYPHIRTMDERQKRALATNLVFVIVQLETCLKKIEHTPQSWSKRWDLTKAAKRLHIATTDRNALHLADTLLEIIYAESETREVRRIHGDLSLSNVIANGAKLGLIDPMIRTDATESNWRYLAGIVPDLMDILMYEYCQMTGIKQDPRLVNAYGAFSHLCSIFVYGRDPKIHGEGMRNCLNNIGITAPSL